MIDFGCTLQLLKRELMNYYNKTVTDLDRGIGIPHSIYCVKPFFRYQGEWLPQDHSKVGKTHSLFNRVRTYCQQGSNVSVLWSIDTKDSKSLEKEVHRYLHNFHDHSAHRTELFLMDCDTAYDMLDQMIIDLKLDKRHDVLAINKFSPHGLNNSKLKETVQKDMFSELFE